MNDHFLKINIEDEVHNIMEDEEFTPEEMDEITKKVKEYFFECISSSEYFWNVFDSCIVDAVNYVKNVNKKI